MAGPSSDDATRMFCREYRWAKLLTKWESLPLLRLEPHRALFDCPRCEFTNTLGRTCPWCLSACTARGPGPGAARRRISCPELLREAQRLQMGRVETRRAMATRPTCAVTRLRPGCGAARARGRPCAPTADPAQTTRRQRHRKGGVHSTADIVAAITYDVGAELKPFLQELMNMHDDEHTNSPTLYEPVRAYADGRSDTKIHGTKSIDASSTSTSTSQRTLRRKQRMTVLRKRSSRTLRKRSMPLLSKTSSKRADDCEPVVTVQALLPSRSPSPSSIPLAIPLGHPDRPLYTAIRKNMSPPGLLPAPWSDAGHTSPHAVLLERGARSLDVPRPATVGRSHCLRQPVPASDWTSGCSVTGETERRLDLARCRSAEVMSYQPREANLGGVVREKVKNLGKGLRELLTRRT